MNKTLLCCAVALGLSVNLHAESAPTPAKIVDPNVNIVTVNGKSITTGILGAYIATKTGGRPVPEAQQAQLQSQSLQELVNLSLLAEAAKQKGLDKVPEIRDTLIIQENKLLSQAALQHFSEEHTPTDQDLQKAYEELLTKETGKQFKARHILTEDEDGAKKVIAELKGGKDFSELAKQYSKDPSGQTGGDLGWFDSAQMVPQFSEAVAALEKGKYSQAPVKTRFGWHVITLDDTREKTPPTLDSVKSKLEMQLQQESMKNYLNGLRDKAKIDINEAMMAKEQTTATAPTKPAGEKPRAK